MSMFNQIVSNLKWIDVKFNDEDKVLMLLNSLHVSPTYENLVTTLKWEKETFILKEITNALLSFNLKKKVGNENLQGKRLVEMSNQEHGRTSPGTSRGTTSWRLCWVKNLT